MRVTEQIDALEVMGVNSLNYLFSKIIALLLYPFVIVLVCFRDFRGWMAVVSMEDLLSGDTGAQMDFIPFIFLCFLKP
jgi:phospholipid/cholesterol/gamma-HCH transport system permease protein